MAMTNGNERRSRVSEFAIASLVLAIMEFVHVLNLEKSLIAIVFGILALKKIKTEEGLKGKNLAVAGIVLGIVGVVVTIVFTIVFWPQMQQFMQQQRGVIPQK